MKRVLLLLAKGFEVYEASVFTVELYLIKYNELKGVEEIHLWNIIYVKNVINEDKKIFRG
ncbi:hypothetical protein K2F43_01655 [Clostridium estertheticum]|uniref:hypothetical protein n=1 Tax=Clostridium estertheticum TaxID=238834 RepID=UPI001C6DFE02|nr:hypothetical protein [Clostridium estertheticum]MBW9169906.1 hypothetical protein [Clostridium estertheticum]WLC74603.1 hypothetical protein KTC99_17825 [Clostridium estertheticum]